MHLFNLSESSVYVCISLSFALLMLTHPPNLHNSSWHPQISLDMNASQQREIELLDIINSVRLKFPIMSNVLFKERFLVCLFFFYLISLGASSSSYFFFSFLRKTSQTMRMMSRTPKDTPTTAPATTPIPRTSAKERTLHSWFHFRISYGVC